VKKPRLLVVISLVNVGLVMHLLGNRAIKAAYPVPELFEYKLPRIYLYQAGGQLKFLDMPNNTAIVVIRDPNQPLSFSPNPRGSWIEKTNGNIVVSRPRK
jgi:hypothetical protein